MATSVTEPEPPAVTDVYDRAATAETAIGNLSLGDRCDLLGDLRLTIVEERDRILDAVQEETNMDRMNALVTMVAVLDHIRYLERNAESILGDETVNTPMTLMGKESRIYYEPLGTVLIIAPWNYPFYQAIIPITSAFVSGNAVVYKPSEHTPMEGLFESLFETAGFDDDWVQLVYGGGETGQRLLEGDPDKISFTGSTATGRQIASEAAESLTPVQLELGGNDPAIVFEDATIGRTARGIVWGAFTHSGQACIAVERLFVQASIAEEFAAELVAHVDQLEQDPSGGRGCDMGCMTTDFQVETVREHVEDAKAKGGTVLTGEDWDGESTEIPPIIIGEATEEMAVATDETFGPVLPIFEFESESEAIERANDTRYGLSASVWSGDTDRADRVARQIEAGSVCINDVIVNQGSPALPFGGTKDSGFGRYKGADGLKAFCETKSILADDDAGTNPYWYPHDEHKYELFEAVIESRFGQGHASLPRFMLAGLKLNRYTDSLHAESLRD